MVANILGADAGIVLLIALVVLVGGSRLPQLARSVGLAGKEFRNAHQEADAGASPTTPVAPAAAIAASADQVTLSRSELEHLLDQRKVQAERATKA